MASEQDHWDSRYSAQRVNKTLPEPVKVLSDYTHLLPNTGRALDLACGLGGNALFLARGGFTVSAWDISSVAIKQLKGCAKAEGLTLDCQLRDVRSQPPAAQEFDVICVSRFLVRDLFPAILAALRPNGLLFYQTFIADKAPGVGPNNPAYLLASNELLQLCSGLQILLYREEGRVGDTTRGFRNEAMVVARQLAC